MTAGPRLFQCPAPPGLSPALVEAAAIAGPYPRTLIRLCHPTWVIDYEHRDAGLVRIDPPGGGEGDWLPRGPRSLHLYAPGTVYWEDTRPARGERRSSWLNFAAAPPQLARLIDPARGHARFHDADGEAGILIEEAARTGHERGAAGWWRMQGLLLEVIGLLVAARPEGPDLARIGGGETLSAAALRLMRERIGERLDCARLAALLQVSPSTLAHRFRAEAGIAPMAALLRLRIARARLLLARGLPLRAIADQLGFCDQYHLSKAFKRIEGRSPRQARLGG